MSKAGRRLIEAADEIAEWKAGKSKATVIIGGKKHQMTIAEYDEYRRNAKKADATPKDDAG